MVFVVALISAISGIAGMFAVEPHGDWDAWNIWTMRARFLFRSGQQWRNAFAPVFEHTDYPLLLSGSIVRCWTWLAGDPHWIPQLIAAAFTLLGAGLLTAGVVRLRGSNQGWLAGLSLLGTVLYLVRGASLYADVPLSFFILAALVLLALYDAGQRPSPGLLVLAGLSAALAAWTKNEGAMFLAIVLTVRTLLAWRRDGGRAALGQAGALLAGAAPVIVVVVLFQISIAAENDLVAGQSWQTLLPRLTDPSRIALILKSFLGSLWHVGRALVVILPLAVLILGGAGSPPRGAAGTGGHLGGHAGRLLLRLPDHAARSGLAREHVDGSPAHPSLALDAAGRVPLYGRPDNARFAQVIRSAILTRSASEGSVSGPFHK